MGSSTPTAESDGWWTIGPRPEDMYERLEDFFPEQDLDRPVIDVSSGRTSPTGAELSMPPVVEPSVTTTFKWVRGELIGKGTYGRVYLALNATTGDMMAVKQVDLPGTPSDTRQMTVLQALKLESETLKDLNHPNIVQYLGFEETSANLNL